VTLGLREIQGWADAVPTWRSVGATAGVLALAFLTREVFLLFVPVLLACHLAAHGRHRLGKLAGAVLLALIPPVAWYGAVSEVRGVDLFAEVIGFIGSNSTVLPLAAFPPFLLTAGVQGPVLAAAAGYALVALARVTGREWNRFHERRRLTAGGLWSIGVLFTFLRAGPLLLDTLGNYGRVLLLAPVVLHDLAAASGSLASRLGRLHDGAAVALAAAFLGVLLYYQHALYPNHLAAVNERTAFLDASWLSQIALSTPWPYRDWAAHPR
jgi:hypothetical protein